MSPFVDFVMQCAVISAFQEAIAVVYLVFDLQSFHSVEKLESNFHAAMPSCAPDGGDEVRRQGGGGSRHLIGSSIIASLYGCHVFLEAQFSSSLRLYCDVFLVMRQAKSHLFFKLAILDGPSSFHGLRQRLLNLMNTVWPHFLVCQYTTFRDID